MKTLAFLVFCLCVSLLCAFLALIGLQQRTQRTNDRLDSLEIRTLKLEQKIWLLKLDSNDSK